MPQPVGPQQAPTAAQVNKAAAAIRAAAEVAAASMWARNPAQGADVRGTLLPIFLMCLRRFAYPGTCHLCACLLRSPLTCSPYHRA